MPIIMKASEYVSRTERICQESFKTPDLFSMSFDEAKKAYLTEQLIRSGYNKAEAARRSGIDRSTFQYQLKKYRLDQLR